MPSDYTFLVFHISSFIILCMHPPTDTINASLLCFISEVEEILQDLKADDDDEPHPEVVGDIKKLESMMNEAVIEGDVLPKPSHKQDSQGYINCWPDFKIDIIISYYSMLSPL